MEIYPNPSSEILNISFHENQKSKQQIQIFNSTGMLLREISVTRSAQFNIAGLPRGLYFVHLKNSLQQAQKFIID
jgi:hypothetical protein